MHDCIHMAQHWSKQYVTNRNDKRVKKKPKKRRWQQKTFLKNFTKILFVITSCSLYKWYRCRFESRIDRFKQTLSALAAWSQVRMVKLKREKLSCNDGSRCHHIRAWMRRETFKQSKSHICSSKRVKPIFEFELWFTIVARRWRFLCWFLSSFACCVCHFKIFHMIDTIHIDRCLLECTMCWIIILSSLFFFFKSQMKHLNWAIYWF